MNFLMRCSFPESKMTTRRGHSESWTDNRRWTIGWRGDIGMSTRGVFWTRYYSESWSSNKTCTRPQDQLLLVRPHELQGPL